MASKIRLKISHRGQKPKKKRTEVATKGDPDRVPPKKKRK